MENTDKESKTPMKYIRENLGELKKAQDEMGVLCIDMMLEVVEVLDMMGISMAQFNTNRHEIFEGQQQTMSNNTDRVYTWCYIYRDGFLKYKSGSSIKFDLKDPDEVDDVKSRFNPYNVGVLMLQMENWMRDQKKEMEGYIAEFYNWKELAELKNIK